VQNGGQAVNRNVVRNVRQLAASVAEPPPSAPPPAPSAISYRRGFTNGAVFRQNVMSQARFPQRGRAVVYPEPVPEPAASQYNAETLVWGPLLWGVLHNLAALVTDISKWTPLLELLSTTIPCDICRTHYTQYYNAHPVTVDISLWLFSLHNDVNHRIGKPLFPIESLPVGDRNTLNIQALSVSFPPEVLAALEAILV